MTPFYWNAPHLIVSDVVCACVWALSTRPFYWYRVRLLSVSFDAQCIALNLKLKAPISKYTHTHTYIGWNLFSKRNQNLPICVFETILTIECSVKQMLNVDPCILLSIQHLHILYKAFVLSFSFFVSLSRSVAFPNKARYFGCRHWNEWNISWLSIC